MASVRKYLRAATAVSFLLVSGMACNAVLGTLQDRPAGGGGDDGGSEGNGGSEGDGGCVEGQSCNGSGTCSSGTCWSSLSDPSKWSTFDTTTVNANAAGFVGAGFDGRYLYLGGDPTARYDTTATFDDKGSWSTFDTTTVNASADSFYGAGFDGRYLYLVPDTNGLVTRYDTTAGFTAKASWSTFDTTTVNPGALGFSGAGFDGRYLYFVPFSTTMGTTYDGLVTRYDTTAGFTVGGSWSTFNTATVNTNAAGFIGAAFDGRYLYLVGDPVARYDTTASFTAKGSWSTFDPSTINANATNFNGAGFDGRYLYLVPSVGGVATRYDTTASFTAATSWATFNTTVVNAGAMGFNEAAFDGRYLYFLPYSNASTADGGAVYDGLLTRYDTTASFTDAASWSTFDTTTVNKGAEGFASAGFDGRYLYLAPINGGNIARFDAKQPPAMPQLCSNAGALNCFSGSFF